ncbi:MAG: alpha/beta fold hydrolase [Phycisphaerae bacterium]|nr:alpha/beta fold hydrolase [Phycisphaerae bacterium]
MKRVAAIIAIACVFPLLAAGCVMNETSGESVSGDDQTDPNTSVVTIETADGAKVSVRRRANVGGAPVIFLHGLGTNADSWDLPAVSTDEYQFESLATILDRAGYDLWLVSFRGLGAPDAYSKPPAEQNDWSMDHYIVYDVPAVVDHVTKATGRRPFVIGNSMGAMVLSAYVQGATLVGQVGEWRIIADPDLAESRQERLAGCVFVEFPAGMRWPDSVYDANGELDWTILTYEWWRTDADMNVMFELTSRLTWLEALIVSSGSVPLDRLRPSGLGEEILNKIPTALADAWRQAELFVVQAGLKVAGALWGVPNLRAEVFLRGRMYIADQMKAGVLQQLGKCVRTRSFVSSLGSPDHVYSDHYHMTTVPSLVIVGGLDRIANPDVTRTVFYDVISSEDKTFLRYDEMGHGEFEAAPIATEQVYPAIQSWLGDRDKLSYNP